jgi:hypothetical protein
MPNNRYVAGSFFQFTAGGWSQLKGYDLSMDPEIQQKPKEDKNPIAAFLQRDEDEKKKAAQDKGLFAVSSVKAAKPPPGIDRGGERRGE